MDHCSCFSNCDEGIHIYQYLFMAILGGSCDFSVSGGEDNTMQLGNMFTVASLMNKQQSRHSILCSDNRSTLSIALGWAAQTQPMVFLCPYTLLTAMDSKEE